MGSLSGASGLPASRRLPYPGFLVLFLHERRGMSAGAATGVLAGAHVLGGASRIPAGRWSDLIYAPIAPLRLLGFGFAATVWLVATVVDAPLAVLLPALLLAGVFGLSWNGLSFTAAAETARPGVKRRGNRLPADGARGVDRDRADPVRRARQRELVARHLRRFRTRAARRGARAAPGAGG